ncbi:Hypothetical_protein [Hexamita inflata]|uniref:Hypothetical_protein n=1 Tax=Hexamita inflata TaxID=28002 RepID=A0AA86QHV3_9EUKA|nr:Hypothetical protein HINF_LOCUS46213 [Hexamita inflata]
MKSVCAVSMKQEKMSLQVDDTVPKPGYTLLGRRRMDNTAFQYMINWVFNNVRDTPIPEICELCKKPNKEHEQDCIYVTYIYIYIQLHYAVYLIQLRIFITWCIRLILIVKGNQKIPKQHFYEGEKKILKLFYFNISKGMQTSVRVK